MSTMLHGKKMFNDEEMLWLNRASLCLVSDMGSSLKFDQFTGFLKVIQDGSFEEKVELVFQMLCEGR